MPSIQTKELELPGCSTRSEDSYHHFEHIRCRGRMQELQSKELEKNRRAVELEQAQRNDTQRAITHDHTYASSSVCSEEDLILFEKPSSNEVVTHEEQDQGPLQELATSIKQGA